ncbi:MAG: HXXEE domain-containing protein [Ktedonobacteraceae bacterium]
MKSETPDHYPLNTQSAMIINTALAYPVYVLPVLFPKKVWLGLAPVLMGFGQVLVHGIVFPLRAKARYGPGFVTALCLHLPIGIAYIRQIKREQPVKRTDWMKGAIALIGFAVGGIAAPILLLRDKESPYRFTKQQMGPYGHQ